MTCSTPTISPATRWVTAAVLHALARHTIVEGGCFTATQLADWVPELTAEQRVHATTRLCALGFVRHQVQVISGQREDVYTVTADGNTAIEAAAQGHVRKSGPKGTRQPNPVRDDALSTKLWALVRLRKVIDSDSAARTLCNAGDDDFDRVRASVRKTLRRWELAGALAAGSRLLKTRTDPTHSNGSKRYVLVRDSVQPPRWAQAVKAAQAARTAARTSATQGGAA